MKALTKPAGRSLGATVAAVALAGGLSVGMVAMDAQPAEAFVWFAAPLLIGSTGLTVAGVTATTGTLMAVAGAATVAGLGIGGYMLYQDSMKSVPLDQSRESALLGPVPDGGRKEAYVGEGQGVPSTGFTAPSDPANAPPASSVRRGWTHTGMRHASTAPNSITYTKTLAVASSVTMRHIAAYTSVCRNSSGAERVSTGFFGGSLPAAVGQASEETLAVCSTGESVQHLTVRALTWGEISARYTSFQYTYLGPMEDYVWKAPGYQPGADSFYKVDVSCKRPDGSLVTITATSPAGEGWLNIPSCREYGMIPGPGGMITSFLDPGRPSQPVWTIQPTKQDQYLDCDPALGQFCTLQVEIDGVLCTAGAVQCVDWANINRVSPSRVKCKYGNHYVDISVCYPLENAYGTGTNRNTITAPTIDGNPDTSFDPITAPWPSTPTSPGTDPAPYPGGNPQPEPGSNPNPQPAPGTAPAPTTGTSPGTDPGTTPGTGTTTPGFPTTGTNPAQSANCAAPSWSWNPVDWVFSPVMCALQEAFVPKMDIGGRIGELQTIAGGKAPLSWMNPVMVGPGGGGCPNWVVHVPGLSKNVVCESSFTAAIVGARGPLFGLVAGAMAWPLFRSLWYAAIPILRVTPGSAK